MKRYEVEIIYRDKDGGHFQVTEVFLNARNKKSARAKVARFMKVGKAVEV